MSVTGIYGVSSDELRDDEVLRRMVRDANGLHLGQGRTLQDSCALIEVYSRQDRAATSDVVEQNGVSVIVSGHMFHPELQCGTAGELVHQLLAQGRLNAGLAECVGEFCLVILDRASKDMTLVSYYLGVRPLFYARTPSGFLFGTNVWPIFKSGWVAPRVDYDAMAAWIQCRYPFNGSTLFRDVRRMPPASIVRYRHGRLSIEPYVTAEPRENGS